MYQMGYQYPVQQRQNQSSHNVNVAQAEAAQLIGRTVKVNRGGPDSIEGTLLSINGDVIILASSNNNNNNNNSNNSNSNNSSSGNTVYYINARHVKSILESGAYENGRSGSSSGNRSGNRSGSSRIMSYIQAGSFSNVLGHLRQKFVQINQGPDKVEGFLAETGRDFLLLITSDREYVRVPVYHIKSICLSNYNKNNNNNNDNNKNNKNSNKNSGKNKSGGRRKN